MYSLNFQECWNTSIIVWRTAKPIYCPFPGSRRTPVHLPYKGPILWAYTLQKLIFFGTVQCWRCGEWSTASIVVRRTAKSVYCSFPGNGSNPVHLPYKCGIHPAYTPTPYAKGLKFSKNIFSAFCMVERRRYGVWQRAYTVVRWTAKPIYCPFPWSGSNPVNLPHKRKPYATGPKFLKIIFVSFQERWNVDVPGGSEWGSIIVQQTAKPVYCPFPVTWGRESSFWQVILMFLFLNLTSHTHIIFYKVTVTKRVGCFYSQCKYT